MSSIAGVKAATLIPAVGGGIVAAALMQGPWHWRLAAGIGGVMSSVFLTDIALLLKIQAVQAVAPELISAPRFIIALERALAFVLGLTGMLFCQAILAAVERLRARAPGIVDKGLDKIS